VFEDPPSWAAAAAGVRPPRPAHDNKRPVKALKTARREVTLEPGSWWRPEQCVRTRRAATVGYSSRVVGTVASLALSTGPS